jgi:hypothetical protein
MHGPHEPVSFVMILQAILLTAAPCGIAAILLMLRDKRGRFSLPMLFALTTFVALAVWAWGRTLVFR